MKKIMYKIVLIAAGATLVTGVLVGISLIYIINGIFESNIQSSSKILNDNFDRIARLEVETALSAIKKVYDMGKTGDLSAEAAKALAIKIARELKYDVEGYFWIDTYDGTNVVYLGKDAEGKNRINSVDKKGNYFIKNIIDNGRKGGGYTNYWFPKPGSDIAMPKRAFSKAFEPYQWVIGTGNYVDDIDNLITKQKQQFSQEQSSITFNVLIIMLIVIVIVVICSIWFGKKIAHPITIITNASKELSKGNLIDNIVINTKDETLHLAEAFNLMKTKISDVISETNKLSQSAKEGNLDYRANPDEFEGSYRNIIIGINESMDNLIQPLKMSSDFMDRLSKGDIPEQITENYKGDFNLIKISLNKCISAINNLVKDTKLLTQSALDGQVKTRANSELHDGDYRLIIQGINETLDLMLNPINEAVEVLTGMSQGDLSQRVKGDYKGDHAVLKNILNQTLDMLPLNETMQVMDKMAVGDLTVKMAGDYKGDSLKLKESINTTLDALNDILHQVANTVDEVTRGALQVADASTALSQGATEQAASLEEITSSMSEIGSQTRHNAENASMANSISRQAKDSADKGNSEMGILNNSMNEINESSKNISKIIKVIDEIAFQTNLLALNAAVEAARAGRHGKGFAVVAEEVRNLAARSATAAKETAELIENSIKTVGKGAEIAIKTAESLEEIKTSSIKVADIIAEINTSSNEQAQGISQINEGLSQIDKVTQTNTASAEESASASEELSGQANMLRELVGRFRLVESYKVESYKAKSIKGDKRNSRSLPAKNHNFNENDFIDLDF